MHAKAHASRVWECNVHVFTTLVNPPLFVVHVTPKNNPLFLGELSLTQVQRKKPQGGL